jgi:predicted XRE-type DNA-binding protein
MKSQHDAAAFIRSYAKTNGITHARLAEITDVSEHEISKIVNFKLREISLERLHAIVAKLKAASLA